MTLAAGSRLGPYEIASPLGAGGMGEVYRAKDTRLDRTVAIKVLPAHVSQDTERKARFEREARAISKLNHPHICTLHDVGSQDGVDFLVMEYLEGETLAERISKGLLPTEQVLRYGVQIADALARAHKQGIVHRDLKPANVLVTKAGTKLLDFGLAKTNPPLVPTGSMSESPTETRGLTAEGTLLGTFQYMAPEQLEGKEADHRADIWALGCVLYEMATGRRAFDGKSPASLIAAILEKDPEPIQALQPATPRSLDRLVRACLAKERDERMQSARDVGRELGWIGDDPGGVSLEGSRKEAVPLAGIALVAALVSGFVVWSVVRPPKTPAPPVARFVLTLPGEHYLPDVPWDDRPGRYPPVALSPDGRRLVSAAATASGVTQLNLRDIDRFEPRILSGTENAELPFFSPDGKWVGYWANGAVFKVPVDGGAPVKIGDVRHGARGAAWGPDDRIILGGINAGLREIDAKGGRPVELTRLDTKRGDNYHGWPDVLPDGKHVLFTATTTSGSDIAVLSLETSDWRVLQGTEGGAQPRYVSTGHLVFFRKGGLSSGPFSLQQTTLISPAVSSLEDLFRGWDAGLPIGHFALSRSGTLVYVPPSAGSAENRLVLVDREGRQKAVPVEPGFFKYPPSVSADGKRLAVSNNPEGRTSSDVWVYDIERGTRTRLTSENANTFPVWSADGRRVFFGCFKSGSSSFDLYWMPADGSGQPQPLLIREHGQGPGSASRDGRFLAFEDMSPESGMDVQILSLGDGKAVPFLTTAADEREPSFSPDDRWLAYASNESGRYEVYVRPFSEPGGKSAISTGGGRSPRWSPRGDELYYLAGTTMMAVRVQIQPTFTAGAPRPLFTGRYAQWYDVTPDGKHFVMLARQSAELTKLNVVLNWSTEIERH